MEMVLVSLPSPLLPALLISRTVHPSPHSLPAWQDDASVAWTKSHEAEFPGGVCRGSCTSSLTSPALPPILLSCLYSLWRYFSRNNNLTYVCIAMSHQLSPESRKYQISFPFYRWENWLPEVRRLDLWTKSVLAQAVRAFGQMFSRCEPIYLTCLLLESGFSSLAAPWGGA